MTADAPPSAKTLAGVVSEWAARTPSRSAVIRGAQNISYGELDARAEAVAKALLALGLRRGDRIGVLLGNEPEWIDVCLGSSRVGALLVPLNTWHRRDEILWTARHCGLSVLIVAARFLKSDYAALVDDLAPLLPELRTVIFIGAERPGAFEWSAFLRLGDAVSTATLDAAAALVSPDSPAFVLYTSGSTADPKGVILNHRGVVENGYQLGVRRGIVRDDRVWLGSPLFYALGATNALPATLTHGAALVLQGHFEAGAAIQAIAASEATVYYATGNMTRAILDHPDYSKAKIGSLQKGNAGTMKEYKRLTLLEMGIRGAVPSYGLTETYGNCTVGWPDDPLDAKLETNGTPLPGTEIRIVEPSSGRQLSSGETGLILVRGYTTPGYLNNVEETSKAVRADGFFDTGDLGSFDSSGRLVFHSRLKEVIKSSGINVSPVEVEQLLASHPDVRDAYVVGVPHPRLGELIVAFVDASAQLSEAGLRDYVKERAASFKVPHHVLFLSEAQLPRLASGKVAKHRLAETARRELGL
jgi:fatty-acyl-CoA synthase